MVTALFALVIAAVVLILLSVVALAWYRDNVQPLARVGSLEVGPQLLRDRVGLEQWRINLESNRLAQANIDREIDAATLAARQSELDQRANALTTTALDDLIDVIYQSQLASAEGVTVSDADVDVRVAEEFAGVERRHVLVVVVEPVAAEGEEASPTIAERRIALERAGAALAAVQSGREWADVAREFSTDESAQIGGDLGFISEVAVSDASLGDELFNLAQGGTTGVVRGTDGVYRVGRVTEIRSATEQPGLRDELTKLVSEPALRDMVRNEIAAERLKAKITDAALAETPDQARIAIIYIAGLYTDDPIDAEGEIKYSEVVFAPNDDLEIEVPAEDPAWETARVEAQQTYDELNALTAGEVRLARFRAIATATSDSPTGEDGGLVEFTTRGLLPEAVGDALFAETHTAGDLLQPVRGDAAWYVLLFEERRDSPEQRVKAVQDLLAQSGADFAAIAKEHSEGPEAEEGGEVGWVTPDQLAPELADDVFALPAGGITDALELGDGHYIIKVEEKATRPLDADQIPDVKAVAFDDWYAPKKDQARKDGVIVIAGETLETEENLEPGGDRIP